MALNPKRTNLAANTACDAMAALCNAGHTFLPGGRALSATWMKPRYGSPPTTTALLFGVMELDV